MVDTSGETSERRPAPNVTVAARKLRHDPLWWVISVLPAAVLTRVSIGAEGPPASISEWVLAALFALVTSALVAVVLLGVRQGWRFIRSGAGTDLDRAMRRSQSAAVAQTLVGAATLLLIVAVTTWLFLSAR